MNGYGKREIHQIKNDIQGTIFGFLALLLPLVFMLIHDGGGNIELLYCLFLIYLISSGIYKSAWVGLGFVAFACILSWLEVYAIEYFEWYDYTHEDLMAKSTRANYATIFLIFAYLFYQAIKEYIEEIIELAEKKK